MDSFVQHCKCKFWVISLNSLIRLIISYRHHIWCPNHSERFKLSTVYYILSPLSPLKLTFSEWSMWAGLYVLPMNSLPAVCFAIWSESNLTLSGKRWKELYLTKIQLGSLNRRDFSVYPCRYQRWHKVSLK